ncbi:MAG TPA: LPS assembly lipoprotein LptE [Candidatus Sulfotelmatobacter sp.]|nr:LPS assembly lipoprotein LptE [Candidatus Sulfotelmatobacter sp.]
MRGMLLALGLTAALSLAACGFRPMYGKSSADPAVAGELASISVASIKDRNGQLLHNALLNRLNPRGEPLKPVYSLQVILTSTDTAEATLPDDTASRNLVTYTATYQLLQGERLVTQGVSTKELSYDYLVQHFSDISAQDAVNHRAADQVAEEIRNALAAYFIRAAEVRRGDIKPAR